MVRDDITAALSGAVLIGNNVLRVMGDVNAGMAHLVLRFIEWLALQLLPDTAETEWLDRHGDIWLKNADGTVGRKSATYAAGVVTFNGQPATVIANATQLEAPGVATQIGFETTEEVTINSAGTVDATVRAIDGGAESNLLAGTQLNILNQTAALFECFVTYDMLGGADEENDEDLRMRVLERIQMPPMGGDAEDYINWTLRVPGVTRAWSFPLEMGIGTVTVRFMMDDLRADNDGFPSDVDVVMVNAYLDTQRPVAVKDFFVVAPIKQFISCVVGDLQPDSADVRAGIEASMRNMLQQKAKPGQTIFAAWKSEAIMAAPEVFSFDLLVNDDDVMASPGHMAVLGDLTYV